MSCLRQTMLYFSGSADVLHATLDMAGDGQGGIRAGVKGLLALHTVFAVGACCPLCGSWVLLYTVVH